ncbi:hypothetical protein EMPG_13043 [Blastomyces silverae]|uniref:Uncharacterized protein n=1 Tax=Blastomyces silverae TaxID=2060906 RepID=A0A0H1BJY1_9EURO|nr:hypothetical protein EMPG_13043 [Blastomyces silverae]
MDLEQQTNMACRERCTSCACSCHSQLTDPVGQPDMSDSCYLPTPIPFPDTSKCQYDSDGQAPPHVHNYFNFLMQQGDERTEPPEIYGWTEHDFESTSLQHIPCGSSSVAPNNFSQDIDTDRLTYDTDVKYLEVNSGDDLYPSQVDEPLQAVSNFLPPEAFQKPAKFDFNQTNIPTEPCALPQTYLSEPRTEQYLAPSNQASIATDEEGLPENWGEFDDAFLAANEPYSHLEQGNVLTMSFQQDDNNILMHAPDASYAPETQQLYREDQHCDSNITYTDIMQQLRQCPSPAPSDETEGTVRGDVPMSDFGEYDDVNVGGGEDSTDAGEENDKYSLVGADARAISTITPHIDKDDTDDASGVDDKGAVAVTTAPAGYGYEDSNTGDNNRKFFVEDNTTLQITYSFNVETLTMITYYSWQDV